MVLAGFLSSAVLSRIDMKGQSEDSRKVCSMEIFLFFLFSSMKNVDLCSDLLRGATAAIAGVASILGLDELNS